MNRRDFLTLAGLSALFPSGIVFPKKRKFFGWKAGHKSRLPAFGKRAPHLAHYGEDKIACLWKPYESVVNREWLGKKQEGPDCVAFATASGMDLLTCKQIALDKRKEQWITASSTDMIYSGGRNVIGEGRIHGGGMWGEMAVEWLSKFGNLLRKEYPPYDLTEYGRETVRYWDRNGIPESLRIEAKKHPLKDYAPVQSADEARDALAAGLPVIMCSYLGLNNSHRDSEGFVRPRGSWSHGMALIGVDTLYRRPGFCVLNSHGSNWASGPTRHGQPSGSSVWVDYDVIDRVIRRSQDSYVLSDYAGFPSLNDLDYILW